MGIDVSHEITEAWVSLAAGAAAGVLYDVFRVLRRHFRYAFVTAVLDAVYWLVCACAIIVIGLSAGEGKQQLYMTGLAVAGGTAYFITVSRWTVRFFELIASAAAYAASLTALPVKKLIELAKKLCKKIKKLFSTSPFWYRIVNGLKGKERKSRKGGEQVEVQAHRYSYEVNYNNSAYLRGDKSGDAPHRDRGRGKPPKRAGGHGG